MKKINLKKIIMGYMLFYFFIMSIVCGVNDVAVRGEFDDYSMPVVSIIREQNFSISQEDIMEYRYFFPELARQADFYSFSGYFAKDGGELTWYYPTYSIACIPLILLLRFWGFPASYGFVFTNLLLVMILLFVVYKYLKVKDEWKLMLIVLLSINPIIFYYSWISAEVFIYAFLGLALICWHNRWYKRAAVMISIAGMMNPTIMSVGLVMIAEYMIGVLKNRNNRSLPILFRDVVSYGSCYIIGLIPMIYNLYYVGHINLTASRPSFVTAQETVFSRFVAYLFDMNYGIFPFYPIIVILVTILFCVALLRKHWKFVVLVLTFIVNVFLYSIMMHINSGMSGIARYNAWSAIILLFAICVYTPEIINKRCLNRVIHILLYSSAVLQAVIVCTYGLVAAYHVNYLKMTPIAEAVLDNCPALYNPLHSTFCSRVNHVDGGYEYETPIIYISEDGYLRKMLVDIEDKEYLMSNLRSLAGEEQWLQEKITNIEEETYISIPRRKKVVFLQPYELGKTLVFGQDGYNASPYVICGFGASNPEAEGIWTDGEEVKFRFWVDTEAEQLRGVIDATPANGQQNVIIRANDTIVYEGISSGQKLEFEFENSEEQGMIEIVIELPDAIPAVYMGSFSDDRKLGLFMRQMVITEMEE